MILRLLASCLTLAFAFSAVPRPALAAYPEKPIQILVAWSAGGATDLMARNFEPALAKALGTNIVVKNLAGAAGTIGTAEAAAAKPDGYTLMISPMGPLALQPHLKNLPYDIGSFEPVCRLNNQPIALMVPKDSPLRTVADVVEAAKAKPGELTYGTAGAGSLTHVAMLALEQAAGIKLKHVPFKGSAEALKAMLGNVVDMYSDQTQLIARYELHPVALYSPEPLPEFGDTPTFRQAGYELVFSNWNVLLAPKGTPKEIVDRLAAACEQAIQDPGTVEGMNKMQTPPDHLGPTETGEFMRRVSEESKELLQKAGIKKQ